MKTLLILLILGFSVTNGYCQVDPSDIPRWARIDHRTQGGGWLWFPGRGEAKSEYEADVMARGAALEYLMQECVLPHKDVQFNERYVVEKNRKFYVFVRASLKQEDCLQMKRASNKYQQKLSNKKLLRVYREYKELIAQKEMNTRNCKAGNMFCFQEGITEFDLGNDYLALAYVRHSCRKGIEEACDVASLYSNYLSTKPY